MDKLTGKATLDDFQKALEDKRNKAIALHKAGAVIKHKDGRSYIVAKDGSWRRMSDPVQSGGG
jgi:hypothetical protein